MLKLDLEHDKDNNGTDVIKITILDEELADGISVIVPNLDRLSRTNLKGLLEAISNGFNSLQEDMCNEVLGA